MVFDVRLNAGSRTATATGEEIRQASWDDLDKITQKKGYSGHLDLVELYNWNSKRGVCEGKNGRWRPDNCWLLDEGGCELYRRYGWDPVRLRVDATRTEILQNKLKPIFLEKFYLQNNSHTTAATFKAQGSRTITSTLSTSKYSGHSVGASVSVTAKAKFSIFGIGGTASVCVSGSYSHNWGSSETWSDSNTTGAVASVDVSLGPGERKVVKISGKEGTLKVRVHYRGYLTGGIAADHSKQFHGHHHWYYPIGDVLKHNNVKNSFEFFEDVELKYYSDIEVQLSDN